MAPFGSLDGPVLGPWEGPALAPTRQRRTAFLAAVTAVVLAVAAAGAVLLWPSSDKPAKATATTRPSRPPTPFEEALALLQGQATALERGDQEGWLAPLNPANTRMVDRYRTIFTNLRALELSHAEFHATRVPDQGNDSTIVAEVQLAYCLSGVACPSWRKFSFTEGPPEAAYRVTFTRVAGVFQIVAMTEKIASEDNDLQPAPWDGRELTVVKGSRVIVAGPANQAKLISQVLPMAEKAAKVVDRYAGYIHTEQRRYRIYIADEQGWKTWYGGGNQKWVVGYEIPLNATGGDVILRAKVSGDFSALAVTIQHELTHVVTVAEGYHGDHDEQWLVEGIAEYIGALPKKPQDTINHLVLKDSFARRGVPKSIAYPALARNADDLTVDTLYAMGHYATACMAAQYGEPKLLQFTSQVLRDGKAPDEAAQATYGKPFAAVDKACLSWIRERV
ncbi:hypothetical protein ACWT_0301 [Actinoplanes sp. SE50]|nr:hypothetical protein ACPL_416 [Actinoplanes sp. SE50/110]ATO79716.1 hypothetical protein ACWT_0301 [Actinoplanes sp. SE50]SLL97119.1 hypothetical protein ACSP50_0315 [Actinoplanes sp. SE50/110]